MSSPIFRIDDLDNGECENSQPRDAQHRGDGDDDEAVTGVT